MRPLQFCRGTVARGTVAQLSANAEVPKHRCTGPPVSETCPGQTKYCPGTATLLTVNFFNSQARPEHIPLARHIHSGLVTVRVSGTVDPFHPIPVDPFCFHSVFPRAEVNGPRIDRWRSTADGPDLCRLEFICCNPQHSAHRGVLSIALGTYIVVHHWHGIYITDRSVTAAAHWVDATLCACARPSHRNGLARGASETPDTRSGDRILGSCLPENLTTTFRELLSRQVTFFTT